MATPLSAAAGYRPPGSLLQNKIAGFAAAVFIGHSGIKYAENNTLRTDAYRT